MSHSCTNVAGFLKGRVATPLCMYSAHWIMAKINLKINVVMFLRQAINVYLAFKDIAQYVSSVPKTNLCCIYRLCSTLS